MRASYLHIETQARAVLDSQVPGDFAEIGVWYGTTFMPLAELCRQRGRIIHAIDSFQGMALETDRDGGQYTKGALSVGGSTLFRKLTKPFPNVRIHEGFVPAILSQISAGLADTKFAFVHLDLDQYQPTMDALCWLWPRIAPGGVVACHDWIPGRDILASGAIAEWLVASGNKIMSENNESHHCFILKPNEEIFVASRNANT